ncbi:uncharacterized protein [Triticum aestivum]|uniref:uncharacterized protein n=1 Tax=Triticum aestivum TaxID=4565 RepID=UPI001D0119FB|nr:uncharacterized protein LOC123130944 [Triticum aestivum]
MAPLPPPDAPHHAGAPRDATSPPVAIILPAPHRARQAAPSSPSATVIGAPSTSRRRQPTSCCSDAICPPQACCLTLQPRHTEIDVAATQYDYGVDDPSLLPEQPDDEAQEPDATVDDDDYYSGVAY